MRRFDRLCVAFSPARAVFRAVERQEAVFRAGQGFDTKERAMTATGTPKSTQRVTEPTPVAEKEAFSPSTEAWIERMMRGAERMHRDEAFRQEIAKRLS